MVTQVVLSPSCCVLQEQNGLFKSLDVHATACGKAECFSVEVDAC